MSQAISILAIGLFIFIFLWIISCLNLYDTSGLILKNYNNFIYTSIISFLILILGILKIDPELKLFQTINYLHVIGLVLLLYIFFSINISNTLFILIFILFISILILLNYNELLNGLNINNTTYSIRQYIANIKTSWIEPEWGFPKGRRNYLENDYNCALREWSEETGYTKLNINILKNVASYNEIFVGTNNKVYKYKYYLGVMNNISPSNIYQKMEISKVSWFTPEECIEHIREYNYEKINIIKKIIYIFNHYKIYG